MISMNPPESLRLFIALELPTLVLESLSNLQVRLKSADTHKAIRWSAAGGMHLTLKFLGETPAEQVENIKTALARAVEGQKALSLRVEGLGCFPHQGAPRVIWAGVGGALPALHALRNAVEREVALLGFPTEARPFSPHLTLGRARPESSKMALSAMGQTVAGFQAGALPSWEAHRLSLMRSQPTPSGSIYTQLAELSLG